jgi:competence protein ComEA
MNMKNRMQRDRAGRPRLALQLAGGLLVLLAAAGSLQAAESKGGSGVLVNINTASAEELQALPGIGSARAEEIVSLRKTRGPFRKVDDLLEVRGIGPAMLDRMRPQVTLSGKTRLGAPGSAGEAK